MRKADSERISCRADTLTCIESAYRYHRSMLTRNSPNHQEKLLCRVQPLLPSLCHTMQFSIPVCTRDCVFSVADIAALESYALEQGQGAT